MLRDNKGLWKYLFRNIKVIVLGNLLGVYKIWLGFLWLKVFVDKKEKWGVGVDRIEWIGNWMIVEI